MKDLTTKRHVKPKSSHYRQGRIEVWDAILGLGLGFLEGSAVKYIARAQHKGNEEEDLVKAIEFLEKRLLEIQLQKDREKLEELEELED